MTTEELAAKHLRELGAFDVPNPILAKGIALRRLLDSGFEYDEALLAVVGAWEAAKKEVLSL